MLYGEVFSRLNFETAVVVFRKAKGDIRIMFCTRNLETASMFWGNLGGLLNGHDKRCNIHNGNVAVVDLAIGECRSFNIDRVERIEWIGEIGDKSQLEPAIIKFGEIEQEYISNNTDTETRSTNDPNNIFDD